jgi:transcriptional regulator with XRE-family HTH domain
LSQAHFITFPKGVYSKIQKRLVLDMDFPERLAVLRKEKNLTQKDLAELTNVHVAQIRRYESGTSQPTLDVIRKIAIALHVSADTLIFDQKERGPGDDLRLHFEAVSKLSEEEKETIKELLEGMLLKHEAKRWHQGSLAK